MQWKTGCITSCSSQSSMIRGCGTICQNKISGKDSWQVIKMVEILEMLKWQKQILTLKTFSSITNIIVVCEISGISEFVFL